MGKVEQLTLPDPYQPTYWDQHGTPHSVRCGCGKLYSDSRKHARALQRYYRNSYHQSLPVRFYVCRWGGWHWTTQVEQRSHGSANHA